MFTVIPFKITDVWFFFPQICFVRIICVICIYLRILMSKKIYGSSWSWSYGSWIYNYLLLYAISAYITTDIASSNLDQGEVYNIMW
jgi:hypothetical protein